MKKIVSTLTKYTNLINGLGCLFPNVSYPFFVFLDNQRISLAWKLLTFLGAITRIDGIHSSMEELTRKVLKLLLTYCKKKIEKYFNVIKWFGSGPQLTLATYLDKFQLSEFLLGPQINYWINHVLKEQRLCSVCGNKPLLIQ